MLCLHGTIVRPIPINLIYNMTTFRKNDLTFDPILVVDIVCVRTEYVLTWYSVFHSL